MFHAPLQTAYRIWYAQAKLALKQRSSLVMCFHDCSTWWQHSLWRAARVSLKEAQNINLFPTVKSAALL
jgi:hypothetical protein